LFGLVAVAAMVGALIAYDTAWRRRRVSLLPGALGLLAGWLHPWQGEILILVILGVEAVRLAGARSRSRSALLPVVTIATTALPLAYYEVLQRLDPAWRLAAGVSRHHPVALGAILLPLLPLAIPAVAAYFRPASSFIDSATRFWPAAALAVWGLASAGFGTGALHAWTGITIPLAALGVQGFRVAGLYRFRGSRYLAVAAVLALTVPESVHLVGRTTSFIGPHAHNQNLITVSEQQALHDLARDPQSGGVLSGYYLGDAVPAETGRRTYSGDYRWSGPAYERHEALAWELLHGLLRGARARAFVLMTGARFVLRDCHSHANLTQTLAPLLLTIDHFGCATVYELR
jgi:hypothetical protein